MVKSMSCDFWMLEQYQEESISVVIDNESLASFIYFILGRMHNENLPEDITIEKIKQLVDFDNKSIL